MGMPLATASSEKAMCLVNFSPDAYNNTLIMMKKAYFIVTFLLYFMFLLLEVLQTQR